jgi:hypothetical protein
MDTPLSPHAPTVDPAAVAEIQGTKPWLRFLSILGFIGTGLCVLAALSMVAVGLFLKQRTPLMLGIALIYVFLAVFFLLASLHLHQAANAAGKVIAVPTTGNLAEFLSQNRKFWKLSSILLIIFLIIYLLGIAAAIILPALQRITRA